MDRRTPHSGDFVDEQPVQLDKLSEHDDDCVVTYKFWWARTEFDADLHRTC